MRISIRRVARVAALLFPAFRLAAASVELSNDPAAQRLTLTDPRLVVNGLGWFTEEKPALRRLPLRMKDGVPPKVWSLAQTPSGVRLRFTTEANHVAIMASGSSSPPSVHITAIGNGGVDLYVDGVYFGSAAPDADGALKKEWALPPEKRPHELTFYLPFGKPLAVKSILVESGATIAAPRAFATAKPVIYYGSSITQGIAASNPGGIFSAVLGRWLNTDFINLGFSGNGFGEPVLAHAVAEIDAACFVVDYWANPSTQVYRDTLPGFIAILREKHPTTPILVTGPYYNPSEEMPGEAGRRQIEKRQVTRDFVNERRRAGDDNITLVDGLEMISRGEADALVDGRHANSLGNYFCARGLEPYLRAALKLPPGPQRR
jgi:hypothetical protein